jgi:hypothetical protein
MDESITNSDTEMGQRIKCIMFIEMEKYCVWQEKWSGAYQMEIIFTFLERNNILNALCVGNICNIKVQWLCPSFKHFSMNKKIQNYLPREFELSLFRSLIAKGCEYSTVDIKYLKSMIVGIWHDDPISVGNSYVMRVL